ncbi:MAG: archaeosine synthase subunit alpha [Candidatus Thermoplasmatota archaeon]
MKLLHRDCLGKIAKITINGIETITPVVLFIQTPRFKDWEKAEILLTDVQKNGKPNIINSGSIFYPKFFETEFAIPQYNPASDSELLCFGKELYAISNPNSIFKSSKKFAQFIIDVRERVGYEALIYLPSFGEPMNYALLSYCGIDLFDSMRLILNARKGLYLKNDGRYKELECNCPSCTSKKNFDRILEHNYYTAYEEIKFIQSAIRNGFLRELVERRVRADTWMVEVLRFLDLHHYDKIEKYYPIYRKCKFLATSKESLFRPDVLRFRKRIEERYRKPKCTKILLLLPCSAKKPYSGSKSHKIFSKIIMKTEKQNIIHEVIVTSPLGIVPRELELFYPAKQYDIPTTGLWDEYEIKMINDAIGSLLKKSNYEEVISHLKNFPIEHKCKETFGSNEKLSEILNETIAPYEKISSKERIFDNILSIANFQFGDVCEEIMKKCKVELKLPNTIITRDGKKIATLSEEKGMLLLTLEGAKALAKRREYFVEIDDFVPKGDVFVCGLKSADEKIRIGDEVAVLYKHELRAVGTAKMSGYEMLKAKEGSCVKIREYIK